MVGKVVLLQDRIPCLSPGNYDVYTLAKDIWPVHTSSRGLLPDPFKRFSLFLSKIFIPPREILLFVVGIKMFPLRKKRTGRFP